jgi:nitrite reductase (NADH) small subunit
MNQNDSHAKKWLRITEAENIPLREGRSVQIAGHDIAIFNLGDRFLAVENKCPHRGGPLADGIVSGGTVVCPLHAWKIDLASGQVRNRPEENPCVKTFATAVQDGVVMLELLLSEDQHIALQLSGLAQTASRLPAMSAGD